MIAYIYKISTGEVVGKLDEKSEENFLNAVLQAVPTNEYAVRFEQRQGEENEYIL